MKKVLIAAVCCLMSAVVSAKQIELSEAEIQLLNGNHEVKEIGCSLFTKLTRAPIKDKQMRVAESVFMTKRLFNGGSISCSVWSDRENDGYLIHPIEHGKINGHDIRVYHSDGSGRIDGENGRWSFGCKADAMTDKHYCYLRNKSLLIARDDGQYSVMVGVNINPGSTSLIRLNKDTPLESDLDGLFINDKAENLIKAFYDTPKVLVRYNQVNKTQTDEVIDVSDFDVAKQVLDKVDANYK